MQHRRNELSIGFSQMAVKNMKPIGKIEPLGDGWVRLVFDDTEQGRDFFKILTGEHRVHFAATVAA